MGLTYQAVQVCGGRLCRSLAGIHARYLSDHCIPSLQRSMMANFSSASQTNG